MRVQLLLLLCFGGIFVPLISMPPLHAFACEGKYGCALIRVSRLIVRIRGMRASHPELLLLELESSAPGGQVTWHHVAEMLLLLLGLWFELCQDPLLLLSAYSEDFIVWV